MPVISGWPQLPQCRTLPNWAFMGKVACSVSDDDMTTCVPPLDTRKSSVKGAPGLHQHSLPACLLSSLEYTSLTWGCTRRWKRRADNRQAESEWINKSLTCVSNSLDSMSHKLQQTSQEYKYPWNNTQRTNTPTVSGPKAWWGIPNQNFYLEANLFQRRIVANNV